MGRARTHGCGQWFYSTCTSTECDIECGAVSWSHATSLPLVLYNAFTVAVQKSIFILIDCYIISSSHFDPCNYKFKWIKSFTSRFKFGFVGLLHLFLFRQCEGTRYKCMVSQVNHFGRFYCALYSYLPLRSPGNICIYQNSEYALQNSPFVRVRVTITGGICGN